MSLLYTETSNKELINMVLLNHEDDPLIEELVIRFARQEASLYLARADSKLQQGARDGY